MVKNFNENLIELLKKDKRFLTNDGDLIKGEVIKRAYQVDNNLIELLISEKEIKDFFFKKIKDLYVFDINKFVDFIQDKNFLDNSYTKFTQKIQLTISGKSLDEREEVALAWGFKDCILEGGMTKEDQKRKEIFFNEVLAKDEIDRLLDEKVLTNFKRYTKKGEEKVKEIKRGDNGIIKENLIIKGNNLLALHTLKSQFAGRVKLIYLDPPFNTENDSFAYNNNFNHSTWLTFMKNRLEVAKELLKSEGLIFVNIDQIEEAYLKVLMDEIFGRDKFLNIVSVRSSTPSGTKTAHKDKTIIKQKDLILVYKIGNSVKLKPQYSERKKWDYHYGYWLYKDDKEKYQITKLSDILIKNKIVENEGASLDLNDKKFKKFYLENSDKICRLTTHKNKEIKKIANSNKFKDKVYVIKNSTNGSLNFYRNNDAIQPLSYAIQKIYRNQRFEEDFALLLCDFWDDIDYQNTQNEGGVSFPTAKKPELLLYRIIDMATEKGDIVLDYHLGSGTTCAVAHKMGRYYIGIEQLDYGENDSIIRLKNVLNGEQSGISKSVNWGGGGDFIYCELMKYNEEAIEKIQKAKDTKELLKIWDELCGRYFLNYDVDIKKFNDNKKDFEQLSLEKQKKLLISMLDKNQLYVNLSEINDKQYKIPEEDKKLNNLFYK